MDKELNMAKFISAKARVTQYDFEKIKIIRKYISDHETRMLMCSMVQSPLDYGNTTLVTYLNWT